MSVIDKNAPLKEQLVRGRDCPWLIAEIKKKIRDRDYYLKKARRSNTEKKLKEVILKNTEKNAFGTQ